MTTQSNIDLNTCVRGQEVKLRDGTISIYYGLISGGGIYPHNVQGWSYMSNGKYWEGKGVSKFDVIEILPMESTSGIDLNTCVPGQKVRLRNGAIVEYDHLYQDNNFKPYTHRVDRCSYMDDGSYFKGRHESEMDVVEILPIEEEPTKPTPELTHSITDQIDVANPDHVSIIPHEHGVTISIKKGLTTISWRHYNH